MENSENKLSRSEKILIFLYEQSTKGFNKIRYEDVVVGLFKKYPNDFHLKGYPEHPDTGDLIHKPIYDFKKKGLVEVYNKVISINIRGKEFAQNLIGQEGSYDQGADNNRLSRSTDVEAKRVAQLEGFRLFLNGEGDKLAENDFYNYLGVTVRTQKNSFIGRLETMNVITNELENIKGNEKLRKIHDYHNFLTSKFAHVIKYIEDK